MWLAPWDVPTLQWCWNICYVTKYIQHETIHILLAIGCSNCLQPVVLWGAIDSAEQRRTQTPWSNVFIWNRDSSKEVTFFRRYSVHFCSRDLYLFKGPFNISFVWHASFERTVSAQPKTHGLSLYFMLWHTHLPSLWLKLVVIWVRVGFRLGYTWQYIILIRFGLSVSVFLYLYVTTSRPKRKFQRHWFLLEWPQQRK